MFAQIQGSARIRLEDGTILRVNYDSHNGWPYTPVGRVLVDRKLVAKDEVSMQRIRDWMEANPDAAKDVRRQNKSYVFFRITDLSTEDEAVGGEGVPLVPGRSIAIDRSLHAYGTPFFIDGRSADRQRQSGNEISPAGFRTGHRLGDRRTGARRYLFRRRRRSRAASPAASGIPANSSCCCRANSIRSRLQRDVPLPPERRTGFFAQFNATTHDRSDRGGSPASRGKAGYRAGPRKQSPSENDDPPAFFERRRTRAVDRLRAYDQATA